MWNKLALVLKEENVALKNDHKRRLTGALTDISGNKTRCRRLNELDRLFSAVCKKTYPRNEGEPMEMVENFCGDCIKVGDETTLIIN